MFFKDFVSVKRQKIKRGASQTYDTPSIVVNIFFSIGENSLNSVYSLELIVYRAILLYGEAAVNY